MLLTIYTQPGCNACEIAKKLILEKGHTYQELILNIGQKQLEGKTYVPVQSLKDRCPNVKSVPVIFEGKTLIGDLDRLKKWLRYD